MLPFSLTDVLFGFIVTWVLGLAPAIIARRQHKGPLRKSAANWIAATTCITFAILFFVVKVALHVPHPRVSVAWVLVFFVARWIMVRRASSEEPAFQGPSSQPEIASEADRPLTRPEIISKLQNVANDPATSDEHRLWATSRLEAFGRLDAKRDRETVPSSMPRFRREHLKKIAFALLIVLAADLILTASGYRLLVRQRFVQPGDTYQAGDWGDLGSYGKPVLACWYWTGRNILPEAFWYGHGRHDRDECALLHNHKAGE
jgi:Ca2+/Na+ antiporter